jgi:hypothetical protein
VSHTPSEHTKDPHTVQAQGCARQYVGRMAGESSIQSYHWGRSSKDI